MRHGRAGFKLGRLTAHRWALFRNLLVALFRHERIMTTEAKAKAMRGLADHIVTLAKRDNLHAQRQVLAMVPDPAVVKKLFDTIAARFGDRHGGTRASSRRVPGPVIARRWSFSSSSIAPRRRRTSPRRTRRRRGPRGATPPPAPRRVGRSGRPPRRDSALFASARPSRASRGACLFPLTSGWPGSGRGCGATRRRPSPCRTPRRSRR